VVVTVPTVVAVLLVGASEARDPAHGNSPD
jgi:hypothetical protein